MNENLKIIAEFVDNATAGLKRVATNVNEFTKGLVEGAKAEYQAIKANQAHAASLNTVKTPVQELEGRLKTLAVAFITVRAVVDGFVNAIKEADKLDDLSGKTGIAANELKNLGFAAAQSDTSLEAVVGAFNKLGRSADKSAEETSQQAKTFAQIGISAEGANGELKKSDVLFAEIADKFQNLEDGPEKSAVAFRLFGAEAKNLIPLLNKGSAGIAALKKEAQELGGVSPDTFNSFAKASGDLFDNIDKVQTVFSGFFTTLAAEIVPIFNVVIAQFVSSAKEGGLLRDILNGVTAVFKNVFVPAIKAAVIVFDAFTSTIKIAGKGLGALFAIIAALATGNFSAAKAIAQEYGEEISKIANEHTVFANKVVQAGNEVNTFAGKTEKTTVKIKSLKKEVKDTKSELQGMIDTLRATNAGFGLDESAKQSVEAIQKYTKDLKAGINPQRATALLNEANALIAVGRALREGADSQEKYKSAMQSITDIQAETSLLEYEATLIGQNASERAVLIEKFKEEIALRKQLIGLSPLAASTVAEETAKANAARATAKAAVEDAKIVNSFIDDSIATAQANFSKRIQLMLQAYETGKITLEDFTRQQQEEYDKLLKKTEVAADKSMVFWQEAAKGMQGALETFFFDLMQGKLTNLADSFKKTIDKMVANALAANLAEALFGGSLEKGGKLGGAAGSAVSWLTTFFGGFKAGGGEVRGGKAYVVGEKRPELFIPDTNGTIMPSTDVAGGGVTVQMTVFANDSQSFESQLQRSERALAKVVSNATRKYNLGAA